MKFHPIPFLLVFFPSTANPFPFLTVTPIANLYPTTVSNTALYAKKSSSTSPLTWTQIESSLEPNYSSPDRPSTIDSALDPTPPDYSTVTNPVLFRERHGWCPYSERVWLALESKNVPYDTIRIDNTGPGRRPSYYSGLTPQIRWTDGSTQGESMDLVRRIDKEYSEYGPRLYPPSIETDVLNKVRAFQQIFPKRSRPSSRAAFLFRSDGTPLWRNEFERVLRETNDLLGETADDGPFFCGGTYTAADVAWAPFLERYAAQLPWLHDGLTPRTDRSSYPYLVEWYRAMREHVPAYACRVEGDASSWRKVLVMAGYGNAGSVPRDMMGRMDELEGLDDVQEDSKGESWREVWEGYREGRPWVMGSPAEEAAAIITRNREGILVDAYKRGVVGIDTEEELEDVLKTLVLCLLENGDGGCGDDSKVGALASFLDERMCVPRDMGRLSAGVIKCLAARYR